MRLNPKLFEAHYLYARACIQEGRLEEAVKHWENAAAVRAEDYQSLFLMSGPLRGLSRPDEARAALDRGLLIVARHLELNPDDARALYLGAGALIQRGEREKALEWAERARTANESDSLVLTTWPACTLLATS